MGMVRSGRTVRIELGTGLGRGCGGEQIWGRTGGSKVPLRVSHHIERCVLLAGAA